MLQHIWWSTSEIYPATWIVDTILGIVAISSKISQFCFFLTIFLSGISFFLLSYYAQYTFAQTFSIWLKALNVQIMS